jgi:hypothetical protein
VKAAVVRRSLVMLMMPKNMEISVGMMSEEKRKDNNESVEK